MTSPEFKNLLLNRLDPADLALLRNALEPVALDLRQQLEVANEPIEYVYFPDAGIISVLAKSADEVIEVAVIGREGMSGITVVLDNHSSPNDVNVQAVGTAHRIASDQLRQALRQSSSLRMVLHSFAHVFTVQLAQTALANGRAKISERLARSLLMAHDRLDGDDIQLTHEFIATMLGVRRPGVTDALHELEGKGLIQSSRAAISVLDRQGLVRLAGSAYGVPEAEYNRLLGPHTRT
jgi:CRP-like cAMP-binding protein